MRPLLVLLLLVGAVAGVLFGVYKITDTPPDGGLGTGMQTDTDADPAPVDPPEQVADIDVQAPDGGTRTAPVSAPRDPGGSGAAAGATGNSLAGLVVDPDGNPLAGAEVVLTKSTPEAAFFASGPRDSSKDVTVQTTADGRYLFRNVKSFEHYGLIARHGDYSRAEVNGVQVAAEGETVGPTIRMTTGPRIFGMVSDESGAPIPEASLRLQTRMIYTVGEVDPDMVTVTAGPDGRYEFRNVSDVYSFLSASAEGFGSITMRSVKPRGRQEQEINVMLRTAEMIGGRVLGVGDVPIEGASVMAMKPDGNSRSCYGQTLSDAEGAFLLDRLEGGPYSLAIRADGYKHQAQQRIETGDLGVVIRMVPEATISGRILDPTGSPVPMGTARLRRVHPQSPVASPTEIKTSFQNPEGKYELSNVRKGTYVVEAEAAGFSPTYSAEFTVTEGQNLPGIDVRLKRGGSIIGQVVDGSGNPIAGARVSSHDDTWTEDAFTMAIGELFPTNATSRTTSTGSDGSFKLENLNPETYQIRVRAGNFSTHVQRGVKVLGDNPKDVGKIGLLRGGTLTGIVYDANRKPVSGADLQLTRKNDAPGVLPLMFKARSGENGTYTIPNMNEGTYRLMATVRRPSAPVDPLGTGQYVPMEVVIREGQTIKQDVSTGG